MKILTILEGAVAEAVQGVREAHASLLADGEFDCFPVESLYFNISPSTLDVGVLSGGHPLPAENYKYVAYWHNTKPNHLSLLAEYCFQKGIVMLNRDLARQSRELINNKVMQSNFFQANNIPFLPVSNTYQKNNMVMKPSRGSCGQGVSLLPQGKLLPDNLYHDTARNGLMFQEFLKYDSDYRVIVVGGKSIGVIERVPLKNDFRANISLGAKAQAPTIDTGEITELAEHTANKLRCDYVGVDILRCGTKLYVLEVNFFANFSGFESIHGTGCVLNSIKAHMGRS